MLNVLCKFALSLSLTVSYTHIHTNTHTFSFSYVFLLKILVVKITVFTSRIFFSYLGLNSSMFAWIGLFPF